ncbi:helix-turn-helix domain-containing protein [Prauserella cavernicola]|uniref:MerR family transcriptional regulator n=1 Tax=Prauserella cavernicola TaxID=2800127 RepID=A0A934QQQ1_9PSEU|nr:MerR family transcriptional regulator [Prauserella cavernicola]MBK1783728.1 MerR family transcriptional regulator [Prauserella cavernicola]
MAWSTRQLAELAGTSLRAVRHYHDVGLLPEPERRANGYKRYGVAHLVRVLRIKRLTDLGFSLSQIAEMGDADEHPEEALRRLDVELAETVERLQRVRAELDLILRESTPTDLPPELAVAAADANLSGADRAFMVVMSRVLSPEAISAYTKMLRNQPSNPVVDAFDELDPDADEKTRQALARDMVPHVRELYADNPGLVDTSPQTPSAKKLAAHSVDAALEDLYNPAQVDVMYRVRKLLKRQRSDDPGLKRTDAGSSEPDGSA